MAKYHVTTVTDLTETYEVEANSDEEAEDIVSNGGGKVIESNQANQVFIETGEVVDNEKH